MQYIQEHWGADVVQLIQRLLLPKLSQVRDAVKGRDPLHWKAAQNLVPVFDNLQLAFLQDSAHWKQEWPAVYSVLSMFKDAQIQQFWPEWSATVLDVDNKARHVYEVIGQTQDRSDLLRDAMSACGFGQHKGHMPETNAESLMLLECAYRRHYSPAATITAPQPEPVAEVMHKGTAAAVPAHGAATQTERLHFELPSE